MKKNIIYNLNKFLLKRIYYLKQKIVSHNKYHDLVQAIIFSLLIGVFTFGFYQIVENKVSENTIIVETATTSNLEILNDELYLKQELDILKGSFNNILLNTKVLKDINDGNLTFKIYKNGNEIPIDIKKINISEALKDTETIINFKNITVENNEKYYFTIEILNDNTSVINYKNINNSILYKVGYKQTYSKLSIFIGILSSICGFVFCFLANKWVSKRSKISTMLFLVLSLITVGFNMNLFYEENKLNLIYLISILALIFIISYCLFYNSGFNNRLKKYYSGILFGLIPFISMCVLQLFSGNTVFDIKISILVVNYIFIFSVYLFIYIFTNRIGITFIIGSTLFYLIGLTYYYVLLFRGLPIIPTDFYSMGTAMSIVDGYKFEFNLVILVTILILFFIFTISKNLKYSFKVSFREKVLTIILTVGITIVIINGNGLCGNVDLWNQKKAYRDNGLIVNFLMNLKYLNVEKPDNYSLDKVNNIVSAFNKDYQQEIQEKINSNNPNIIVIMNETFSDLGVLGKLNTNQDYMPFIHSLKDNTIKGNLFVSVYGGYTANSEWEFLTGNSMAFITARGIPYQQYIHQPTNSLVATLKSMGYSTTAIHPYYGDGWDRNKVYPLLGFDKFITINDFKDPEVLRGRYISDADDYKKIIETYENKKNDGKTFIFNTTIQNHGGYSTDNNIFNDNVYLKNHNYDDVNEYLSLIKKSDEAFENLLKYFSKEKEPTIIVMFGDHQPKLNNTFYEDIFGKTSDNLTLEETQRKYTVPFIIWANYDIEERYLDKISANYLSTILLDIAKLPLPKYNEFLKNEYTEIPVINANGYIDKKGNYHTIEELNNNELINDYRILQYNNMFDKENIISKN